VQTLPHPTARPCLPPHREHAAVLTSLTLARPACTVVHMLELQLPRPMPHALPREPPFDFYASSSRSMSKLDSTMQLPMPRMATGHDHVQRAPLTPPDLPGSAVRVVSLPPNQGAGHQYGYQLPAIGNSRSVAAPRSPSPQRQPQQPPQDVTHTPRKKWSISPNLRIPPTISTPQEGLPQLAAEVSFVREQFSAKADMSRLRAYSGSRAQPHSSKSSMQTRHHTPYSPSCPMHTPRSVSRNG
jgi:hypothetical protein